MNPFIKEYCIKLFAAIILVLAMMVSFAWAGTPEYMEVIEVDEFSGLVVYEHVDQIEIEDLTKSTVLYSLLTYDDAPGDKNGDIYLAAIAIYVGSDYIALDKLTYEYICGDYRSINSIELTGSGWVESHRNGNDESIGRYELIDLYIMASWNDYYLSGSAAVKKIYGSRYLVHNINLEELLNADRIRITLSGVFGQEQFELSEEELVILKETIQAYLSYK